MCEDVRPLQGRNPLVRGTCSNFCDPFRVARDFSSNVCDPFRVARDFSYYLYLFMGVIILPRWLRSTKGNVQGLCVTSSILRSTRSTA